MEMRKFNSNANYLYNQTRKKYNKNSVHFEKFKFFHIQGEGRKCVDYKMTLFSLTVSPHVGKSICHCCARVRNKGEGLRARQNQVLC